MEILKLNFRLFLFYFNIIFYYIMINSTKTQKIITEELEQKNIGVNKIILNINGKNSQLTTNKNSILKYSLNQPINLEVGDTISCIGAFVEEKGLSSNTISFEEDIEAEMRFMYYKQGDTGDELSNNTDVGFVAYPKMFPDAFFQTSNDRTTLLDNYLLPVSKTYESIVGDLGLNMTSGGVGYGYDSKNIPDVLQNITTGCNGNYYYLMESVEYNEKIPTTSIRDFKNGKEIYMRPVYGSKTIKVPAGNYSVDSLSNIISAQLNGSLGKNNNEFSDALLDKLYNPNGVNKDKMFSTYPYFKDLDDVDEPSQQTLIGTCGEELGFERRVDGFVKQINYSNDSYYEAWAFQNLFKELQPTGVNPTIDPLQRIKSGATFPNTNTQFINTQNLVIDNPNTLYDLLEADINYGNGKKNSHFYLNGKALKTFYETEDKWYNLDGLKDNTADIDNFFFPASLTELCYNTTDLEYGFLPKFSTNPTLPSTNPYYTSENRFVTGEASINYQMIFPVKGLNVPNFGDPPRQVFAGTSIAQLSFNDNDTNRFALSNFHEFYKLPNLTADGSTTSGYGGQQSTKFNNPYYNNDGSPIGLTSNATNNNTSPVYPIDSSSGVAINNFDFALVKNTKIYKDLLAEIQSIDGDTASLKQVLYKEKLIYDLFTKPFDEFFNTKADAETAWSKSLWSRLGFSYNQLGDISSNLESYKGAGNQLNTDLVKHKGLITHNSFNYSMIVSSDGLGAGNPNSATGTPMQNYRLQSYFNGNDLFNSIGTSSNNIHLLVNSKPINASVLPDLNNGRSYLLIESDIIKPNFKNIDSNWGNLLAIMSKENSSNDTIFGAEPIEFTITEKRLLTEINLYIKNPDGTLANDDIIGKNNGFILQISKPIPVQTLPIVD